MCGIYCSLSRHGYITPDDNTKQLLKNRGPDCIDQHQILLGNAVHATFWSTVLSLRGETIVKQPLRDSESGSVLCWNGEAWSIQGSSVNGNDSKVVFAALLEACSSSGDSAAAVIEVLALIRGPYAILFYDALHKRVFYGRDCLGRRSLLRKSTTDGSLVLSSVCDNASGDSWSEIEADGIYIAEVAIEGPGSSEFNIIHVPHRRLDSEKEAGLSFTLPFPAMNRDIPSHPYQGNSQTVDRLKSSLERSLQLRTQHVREAVQHGQQTEVAVLFSGGLDCTILARMCHDLLPKGASIDLLNVAFENPRIHSKLDAGVSPYEKCPDRITGRSSHAELSKICPGRDWRFVEVNVPYSDTQAHRPLVMSLMHPHNTEMDLSISLALYFASRGVGICNDEHYSTPAHVLLSGLGADELFGGYQRHPVSFARQGYTGLLDELELDFNRLGKRNLGRDDRVISNSSKEVRFPFLDEDFIALVLELPVAAKCDFGVAQEEISGDPSLFLEPGKRALRLLAWQLGMKGVAAEKKRAIQFGSRTAKMETGKTKGTHVLT